MGPAMTLPPLVISRTDRIGDLLLSFYTLHHAGRLGFAHRILHLSPMNRDLGVLAQFNGLAEELWFLGDAPPPIAQKALFLSLYHASDAVKDLRKIKAQMSLGPRSKLSSIWSYSISVAQNRSTVLMSEAEYNLELLQKFADLVGLSRLEPEGLPPLKVPPEWKTADPTAEVVINVCNRGSAKNWPIEKYIDWGLSARALGQSVDFIVSGEDQQLRLAALKKSGVLEKGCRIFESFATLAALVEFLSKAKKVVSSSTGTLHLAHALGVEVVGIYPVKKVESFERWKPFGYWHRAPVRLIEIP